MAAERNEIGADFRIAVESTPLWFWRLVLILAGIVLYGWDAGDRGLWSAHEGRAAQNAATILETGDWTLPALFTGDPETQKPPLYYWMVAAAAKASGGVDAASVRFPALVAGIAGLLIVFEFGRRLGGVKTGVLAAVILGATTRFAWLARVGRIDMPLAALTLGALFLFWNARVRPRAAEQPGEQCAARLPWTFYLLLGLGLLIKGPIAVVLVALPILSWMAFEGLPIIPVFQQGALSTWRDLRVIPGGLLTLAVAGPWFAYASYTTDGRFFREFFLYHNVERALGTDEALKSNPFWFYIPRTLVDAFPWSLLAPALALGLWKRRSEWRAGRQSSSWVFLIGWIVSTLLFLSVVSFKRMDYALPIYPAFALLLAEWLRDRRFRYDRRLLEGRASPPERRARLVTGTAYLCVALAAPLAVWAARQFTRKGGLAKTILGIEPFDNYLNETDAFMMHGVEGLLRAQWPLLAILSVVLVGCVWYFHVGWHQRRNGRIALGLAVPWLACFLVQVHVLLPSLNPSRDMQKFAEIVRHLAGPVRTVHYFGKFDPDLVFHAGKPARLVGDWEELVRLAESPEPCFVVLKTEQVRWVKGDRRLARLHPLASNSDAAFGKHREPRTLLTNRPADVAGKARQDVR
ncbi:MAG TPA: glycosyltransferase family 39 protein [Planctomycetia bacterium]|nr:glycosyltransferase family 39 protein [Planctomycetia bacterium]